MKVVEVRELQALRHVIEVLLKKLEDKYAWFNQSPPGMAFNPMSYKDVLIMGKYKPGRTYHVFVGREDCAKARELAEYICSLDDKFQELRKGHLPKAWWDIFP